jgi:hypothetical protein
MAPKKKTSKTTGQEGSFVCPLCLLFGCVRDLTERKSAFFQHMNNARIEFLDRKSRLTKIKVED